jgi:hypothetical protein
MINKNDIVITRDNQLAKVIRLYSEDGVQFAAIKYLDGSNPQGDGALDPEARICEHCVSTRRTWGAGGQTGTERGLRRATPHNLRTIGLDTDFFALDQTAAAERYEEALDRFGERLAETGSATRPTRRQFGLRD